MKIMKNKYLLAIAEAEKHGAEKMMKIILEDMYSQGLYDKTYKEAIEKEFLEKFNKERSEPIPTQN